MFLTSNYQPLKTSHESFSRVFNQLLSSSKSVDLVTGYVSEKSIRHLEEFIFSNGAPYVNLIIGMHYFDKFTHSQYTAALELENFLEKSSLGSVRLVTSFPFHGKMYSFNNGSEKSCLIGSSNLDNILPHKSKVQYETDIFITDNEYVSEVSTFISSLYDDASQKLSAIEIDQFKHTNNLLEDLSGVQKLDDEQLLKFRSRVNVEKKFKLPLKPYEKAGKSNLHPYLGKGRENKSTGVVLPRSWYEVELIVPKSILDDPIYPKKHDIFHVVTDDGYRFECKTSGDYGKNFRSVDDLKKLGKWIKGRMQNAGVLKAGEKVTKEILKAYGRDNIEMSPTTEKDEWFLNFRRS